MLLLPFSLNGERYAIDAAKVVEILPQVILRELPDAPDYVAGVFNCRGRIVPVIDLCRLVYKTPCSAHISTRMVLTMKKQQLIALLCDDVVETVSISEKILSPVPFENPATPYLSNLIKHDDGLMQLVEVDALFGESVDRLLFGQLET